MFGASNNSHVLSDSLSIPHRSFIKSDCCTSESAGLMGCVKKVANNKLVQTVVVIGIGAGLFYALYFYR